MQKGLVWNIEQGLSLTPVDIGRAETLRTQLWQRVRAFLETRDLLILPTVAVPPFPWSSRIRPRSTASRSTTTRNGSS
jgi:amidase